jgi:ribose 5-phosphate isomerase A
MSGDPRAELKRLAAEQAVQLVESGMVVGLGSGTTAAYAVSRVGELLGAGTLRNLLAVPTSLATEAAARAAGIPLAPPDHPPPVDLTIDGADEVEPQLDMIKGHGGALLREKIVAQASRRLVIIVDDSKLSPRLGLKSPLPVEVVPFAWKAQVDFLASLGGRAELRTAGDAAYRTDQGNLILDCRFEHLGDPALLAARLADRAGIVEHGLFLGLATDVIVAGAGGVRRLTRPQMAKDRT